MMKDSEKQALVQSFQGAHEVFEELKAKGSVTDEQMVYVYVAGNFQEKWSRFLDSLKSNNMQTMEEVFGTMSYAERALVTGALERSARRRLERESH